MRTNLDAGRLRLTFLADEVPSELRAIVEFLNRQMSPAIVQAIEVSLYTGPDGQGQTLLAKLIGETEAAKRTKTTRSSRTWDKSSWLAHLAEERPAEEVQAAERVFAWAEQHDPPITVTYGTGATTAAAMFGRDDASAYLYPFYAYNSGSIEIQACRRYRRSLRTPSGERRQASGLHSGGVRQTSWARWGTRPPASRSRSTRGP